MNNQEMPRSLRQHISVQQVGAETLVYDEQRHKAFCLNEISSVIWRLADGENTVAEISVAASLQLKASVSEALVVFAVEGLRADGLIELSSTAEAGETLSRRTVLQGLVVGGAMLFPAVAAIVAPTAAQAYSGCFDCDSSSSVQTFQAARASQLARARSQQLNSASSFSSVPNNSTPTFSPYAEPGIGQPVLIDPDLQR